MTPTRRAAEQEHFGATDIGEAQAENPRLDREMIDEGRDDFVAPEEVVKGFFLTVFNAGQIDAIEDFVAPDHMNHDPTAPDVPPGPQGVRRLAQEYLAAFEDLSFEIEDIFGSEDRVAHRWTMTGTHIGEFMGLAATGRRVAVRGLEVNRIARGKIAESWAMSDAEGLRKQLEAPEGTQPSRDLAG